jgi:HEAT repeat protein
MVRNHSIRFFAVALVALIHTGMAQDQQGRGISSTSLEGAVKKEVAALSSADPRVRAAAACALGRMRSAAAPAIPYLLNMLGDGTPIHEHESCGTQEPFEDEPWEPNYKEVHEPSPGEAATHALMAIGEPALELLKQALLQAEHWRARKNAAWALAHRGQAVEQLVLALKDPAWQVRAQAAYALFQRGGDSRVVVDNLAAALHDEAWQVREQAVFALGHKGSSKADVVGYLLEALKNEDARVRRGAAQGLWHCADSRAFDALLAALKDADAKVRANVAQTLGNRADDREVQLLLAARNDADERVRSGVRQALSVIKHRMQGTTTNLRRIPIPAGESACRERLTRGVGYGLSGSTRQSRRPPPEVGSATILGKSIPHANTGFLPRFGSPLYKPNDLTTYLLPCGWHGIWLSTLRNYCHECVRYYPSTDPDC